MATFQRRRAAPTSGSSMATFTCRWLRQWFSLWLHFRSEEHAEWRLQVLSFLCTYVYIQPIGFNAGRCYRRARLHLYVYILGMSPTLCEVH